MLGLPSSITWRALVYNIGAQHQHDHKLTDDVCDYILWEHTAFPVAGLNHVVGQIHEFFAAQ